MILEVITGNDFCIWRPSTVYNCQHSALVSTSAASRKKKTANANEDVLLRVRTCDTI